MPLQYYSQTGFGYGITLYNQRKPQMSLTSTLKSHHSFNGTNGMRSRVQTQSNLFNKIDVLAQQLTDVAEKIISLGEECASIKEEKESVATYLERKSDENRLRLLKQLEMFENEVVKKMEYTKQETHKIDEKISHIREAQLTSMQMILAIQRRVQQLELHLGQEQQK